MSKENTIIARRGADGTVVQVLKNGGSRPLPDKTDWLALQDQTDDEVRAAALDDPDTYPCTGDTNGILRPVPRAKTLRRALGLTQEEFATRYQIPIGTLRDWEQGRAEPDQPARAYLKAIAGDPTAVQRALQSRAPKP